MVPRAVRILIAALAAALLATPATAVARPLPGIGDEDPASFSDPRLRWLGFRSARTVVPYDVATRDPARVDAWLSAVRGAGLAPHVAFTRAPGQTVPATPAAYGAAFEAFRARWPDITVFTAWNEANHASQPIDTRPDLAAAYYRELRARCGECTGPAVDVVDSGAYLDYARNVRAALADLAPRVWGLHNYGDVNNATGSTTRMLGALAGELWVTETGGIVELTRSDGTVAYGYDEVRAGRATRRAVEIAEQSSRITRAYVYQWHEQPWHAWDSALVRYDSSLRPSFDVIADWLRPGQPPPPFLTPEPDAAAGEPEPASEPDVAPAARAPESPALEAAVADAFTAPAPAGTARLALGIARPAARLWLVGRRIVIALRCSAGATAGCSGAFAVRGRHPLPRSLRRPFGGGFRLTPGSTRTLAVRAPRALVRRIRTRRTKRLVVALEAGGRVAWIGVLPVRRIRNSSTR